MTTHASNLEVPRRVHRMEVLRWALERFSEGFEEKVSSSGFTGFLEGVLRRRQEGASPNLRRVPSEGT